MPNKIQIKRTSVTGRTPNTTSSGNSSFIDTGELALNITDGKLFSSDGTNYIEVGANLNSLSVGGAKLTANSTLVNAVALNVVNQTNTATLYVTTSANVGTIFTVNSSTLVVNSTAATGTLIRVSHTSTGNILVIEDESSEASPFVIDASGYLIMGSNTVPALGTVGTSRITAAGAAADLASIGLFRNDESAGPAALTFGKTRVTTSNLAINDVVGRIEAAGNDGTDNRSPLTRIEFSVDGVTSLDDMPGRITLSTTADGAAAVTERMRIDSTGLTTVNSTLYVVTSANVASAFLANSTGAYHTGVMRTGNSTTRIILGTGMGVGEAGVYVIANTSVATIQGEFQGSSFLPVAINPNGGAVRLAGTFGTTNGVNVTNTGIVVGNSTANATLSYNLIQTSNSTSIANLTPTTLAIGSITVNSALANLQALNVVNQTNTGTLFVTTSANVGTNVQITTNSFRLGNASSNVNITNTSITHLSNNAFNPQVIVRNSNNDEFGPYWNTGKSRAGAAVQNNDDLGTFMFQGHDGTDFRNTAYIAVEVDGTVSTSNVPSKLLFFTTNTSGNLLNRLTLFSNGNVDVNNGILTISGGPAVTNGSSFTNTVITVGNSTINTTANSTTILVNGVDLVATQKRAIAMSMIFGR